MLAAARAAGVPARHVGRTGGQRIRISVADAVAIDCAVTEAEARWTTGLASWMDDGVAATA